LGETNRVADRVPSERPGSERPARLRAPAWWRAPRLWRRLKGPLGRALWSSLARRIVVLNVAGLLVLLTGVLWLNQTRIGVIDARVESLTTQAEVMAAAIASSATVDTDTITIDPDRLLSLQAGETAPEDVPSALEFSINPERVAPLLRRLTTTTRVRARAFDRDGTLLVDTRGFYSAGDILRLDLPPPVGEETFIERTWSSLKRSFGRTGISIIEAPSLRSYPEVQRAMQGTPATVVRVSPAGGTIVYVAVPIQRFRSVRGTLLLSTREGDIDDVIGDERRNILVLFAGVILVMGVLSALLANTVARPVQRLAEAAVRVRRSIRSQHQIPDMSDRSDEIGRLSGALREMTNALYRRIEAIESFAADVAHELKNPLTSLRSAVETLPLARSDDSRRRLLTVIEHDVKRLDRLISDISDASRLDAELARAEAEPVDVARLLETVVGMANEVVQGRHARVRLVREDPPAVRGRRPEDAFLVMAHDGRLAQVFTNLIDNAVSFAPVESTVLVTCRNRDGAVEVTVEDDGPGIPDHALERVFERFYTDRPEQGFGNNSGLGLSISRQIVEAYRGTVSAGNRPPPPGRERGGAVFTVSLPAAVA
jgi:two-component system sensor histidine kinase ChvG